ncbi:hypothetical protein KGF57_003601 [Candida theae]|uniref:Uncharacterized protein n=1 Tax=Candida theae TaxID=1198502 RepID=A0AAD5BD37_9ASCO|nr:uncharacterized protein KGF57_003601 [Candida theae]KAI5955469.1 hypothetical protein KGF57_003601 [Candida theae]
MLMIRCCRKALRHSTTNRWSVVFIRHNSLTDPKKRETIHLAINLLFPNLGDPQYIQRYRAVDKQIVNAVKTENKTKGDYNVDIPQEQTNHDVSSAKDLERLKTMIMKCKKDWDCIKESFVTTSKYQLIDTSFTHGGHTAVYESENEFYNEVLQLDKFNSNVEISPLIFCPTSYSIDKCATALSARKCETGKLLAHLRNLQNVGRIALGVYWRKHLGKELDSQELNYTMLVAASGIYNALDIRLRKVIKHSIHTGLQYSLVFYQYLGLLTVHNGKLSPHFILSMEKLLEKSRREEYVQTSRVTIAEKMANVDDTISTLPESGKRNLKKMFQFAEHTLKLLGKRVELLEGLTSKKTDLLLSVKKQFPELNDDTNMANLGYLITKDYRKYALEFLGIEEPSLGFGTRHQLVKIFGASNFELPVISNVIPQTASPYQIRAPIINPNLTNRILLLSRRLYFGTSENGKFMGSTIQNFELFGRISYSYFIKLALERVQSATLTNDQLFKIRELAESLSFKAYIVDLMKFFDNQKQRLTYMSSIEQIRYENLIYIDQFDSIFACLSERQKEKWCHDLIAKIVTVLTQMDWQYVDEFLSEVKAQLLKRQEYLSSVHSSSSRLKSSSILRKLARLPMPVKSTTSYYNLGMEYLSFLNVKFHISCPLKVYRRCLDLFEENLLRSIGFDNVTRLGNTINDTKDDSLGLSVIKKTTSQKETLETSFMGVQVDRKLRFRMGTPGEPFWNYKSSQLTPPRIDFDATMNKILLVNRKIAPEFLKRIGVNDPEVTDTLFKYDDLGFRYYRYMILYTLTKSKLSSKIQDSVFNIFTDKVFKRKLNTVTGVSNSFYGDLKANHIYHELVAKLINSDYLDLYYHHQIFNQFIAMQYMSNKSKLNNWICGLIDPLIKLLEECADDYDMQAVLFQFERAYQK